MSDATPASGPTKPVSPKAPNPAAVEATYAQDPVLRTRAALAMLNEATGVVSASYVEACSAFTAGFAKHLIEDQKMPQPMAQRCHVPLVKHFSTLLFRSAEQAAGEQA